MLFSFRNCLGVCCLLPLWLASVPISAGVVDDSLDTVDRWWDKTREYADSTVDRARRLWQEEGSEAAELWNRLLPGLDEVLREEERQRRLPESAWFGEDRESAQAGIDELLDEASSILVGDNRYRREAAELEQAMAENRQAISELKHRKMTAPADSLWRKSVADINEEIAEREQVLREQAREIARLRGEFAGALRETGLDIDAGRLEFLMSTVVGDDVVDMTLAFEQVRDLTEQLEALIVESREDLATARRYYGMYTVLLKILDRMHGNLLAAIDERYLPRIGGIRERAEDLRSETRRLLAREPSKVLRANLQAQALTIEAADRYRDYLKQQRRQMADSRKRLGRDLAVAVNTYETVKVSGELVTLMKDSRNLLQTLFSLQVPPLRAFENLEMKQEFERLTSSLRSTAL